MSFFIHIEDFESAFPERILERGINYFESGLIINLSCNASGNWGAVVLGSEEYAVTVKPAGDGMAECRCSCPYAIEAPCKHIAAVLIALEEQGVDMEQHDEQPVENMSPPSTQSPLDALLQQSGKEELAEFIRNLCEADITIEHKFLAYMTPPDSESGKPYFRKLIKSTLEPARRKGIVFSQEARRVTAPVYDLLNRAEELKKTGHKKTVIDICQTIVEEMVPALQFIDDSNADAGEAIRWAIGLLYEESERPLPSNIQQEFFKWCLKSIEDKRYEGWDFPGDFIAMAVTLSDKPGQHALIEELLNRRIEQLAEDSDSFWNSYSLETAVLQKVRLLRKQNRTDEADQLLEKYRNQTRVLEEMIRSAWERGDTDRVQELAEDAIEKHSEKAPGLVAGWKKWLVKVAEAGNNTELLFQRLENLFFSSPEMETYRRLKEACPAESWSGYASEIILKLENDYRGSRLLPNIYIEEERFDQLLNYLQGDPDFHLLKQYGHLFIDSAPDEIFTLYEKLIRDFLGKNTGRKKYREMCRVFDHLCSLGLDDQTIRLMDDLKERYFNRPALIEEFDKQMKRF